MSYNPSKLDANQVLKSVYDDDEKRLRVDAAFTGSIGELQVDIQASDGDNIAISDGTHTVVVNSDGSLNVNISDIAISAPGDNIAISDGTHNLKINPNGSIDVNVVTSASGGPNSYYDEVTGVISGITTTIITYNPTSESKIKSIAVSGDNLAVYELYKNSVISGKVRTTVADLNAIFTFADGFVALSGDVIEVKVFHNRPSPGDFNAGIEVFES